MVKIAETKQDFTFAKSLFSDWEETLITSCLERTMGCVFITPNAAAANLGDFIFFAGEPSEELIRFIPDAYRKPFILVPQNTAWGTAISRTYPECKKNTRYAFYKDTKFDTDYLISLLQMFPQDYEWKLIDQPIFDWSKQQNWCRDWVSQFEDYESFARCGLGVVILKDGIPVSGASSYSVYPGGIEIEIQTLPAYRRQGLATCAAAALILECLKRNLNPSWDAANLWSKALAEKLGYSFAGTYTAYFYTGKGEMVL